MSACYQEGEPRREQEPELHTRNPIDVFFRETAVTSGLQYAVAPVVLTALGMCVGGAYEGISEGIRTYNMITAQNFAEAVRSGLAVLGSGVGIAAGVKVLESVDYVMHHPNFQRLYDYHRRREAYWNESLRRHL